MKCPKCGYNSFEQLDDCKKCGQNLSDHKAKFNLRGFYRAGQVATATISPPPIEETALEDDVAEDESVDFGFDFLDEEEDQASAPQENLELGDDYEDVSIEQPFGVDSETVPADDPSPEDTNEDPGKKPDKGSEFSF